MNNNVINNGNANVVNGRDSGNNIYGIVMTVVIIVLVIAILLLVLLLTGNINGKNRLFCTKTTQEDGYTYKIDRYYKFKKEVMQRVDYVYTYDYENGLTDEFYVEKFKDPLDEANRGITGYGYNTQISREDNIVKITAYNPSFFNESYDSIVSTSAEEGYTCESLFE